MSTPAIAIEAIHKHYGALHALKGVSFEVARGEFFGLLGPNGAGKSTLINSIAGLTRADQGAIRVLDADVVRDYRRARMHVGIVPQELVFDPFFTVHEVLRIQAGYFGLGREVEPWLEELMAALQLSDKRDANMRTLSGGMKRRVLVAQALVHRPEVVVLDEPTAGVDVELRQSLWVFIRQLHASGHTIVLTTHYLEEAESLCDRIAILNKGELVALDRKTDLLARGIGQRVRLCVSVAAACEELPAAIAHMARKHENKIIEFEIDRDHSSVVFVLDALRQAGHEIVDLHTDRADLEDVFVELVRSTRQ